MVHLPAEIWCHIADYLPPSALDAMLSTSGRLRQTLVPSAAIRQHRALKERYALCTCGHGQPDGELTHLALNVFARPELSFYITKLVIVNWSSHFGQDGWRVYTPGCFQKASDAARRGRETLYNFLRCFETETGIFILLLQALRKLRSLHILDWPERESGVGGMIESTRDIGFPGFVPVSPPVLPGLNEVSFGAAATSDSWPSNMVEAFAGIPTVKKILVQGVEIDILQSDKLRRESLQRLRHQGGTFQQFFYIPDEAFHTR